MLLRGSEGNELELRVVGHQFPGEERDPWESNALLVSVRVLTPDASWEVVDPCLTTWEAAALVSWLAHAALGAPPAFREPNVTFSAAPVAGVPLRAHLRARFALEHRPPWARTAVGSENLGVDLDVGRDDLLRAAAALGADLAAFPPRGDDPTL
jgi:hypothetical protein